MTTTFYQLFGKILDTYIDEHYWQFENAARRAQDIAKAANTFYNYGNMDDPENARFKFEPATEKQLAFNSRRLAEVIDTENDNFQVLQILKVDTEFFDQQSEAVTARAGAA